VESAVLHIDATPIVADRNRNAAAPAAVTELKHGRTANALPAAADGARKSVRRVVREAGYRDRQNPLGDRILPVSGDHSPPILGGWAAPHEEDRCDARL
jgi:hypothetical protein